MRSDVACVKSYVVVKTADRVDPSNLEGDGAVSAGDPQPSCHKATDITELLLQVYLIAWTMTQAKDDERGEGLVAAPRPAARADRCRSRTHDRDLHTGRRSRRPSFCRMPTEQGLTRGGCAAASPVNGVVSRLRALHCAGRERRVCRWRSAACATAAPLATTNQAGFAVYAPSRLVWRAVSCVVSYTPSRLDHAGSSTTIREEVYVGS
jgi:hypothetical protein